MIEFELFLTAGAERVDQVVGNLPSSCLGQRRRGHCGRRGEVAQIANGTERRRQQRTLLLLMLLLLLECQQQRG